MRTGARARILDMAYEYGWGGSITGGGEVGRVTLGSRCGLWCEREPPAADRGWEEACEGVSGVGGAR